MLVTWQPCAQSPSERQQQPGTSPGKPTQSVTTHGKPALPPQGQACP